MWYCSPTFTTDGVSTPNQSKSFFFRSPGSRTGRPPLSTDHPVPSPERSR